jgi:hypothetical protein
MSRIVKRPRLAILQCPGIGNKPHPCPHHVMITETLFEQAVNSITNHPKAIYAITGGIVSRTIGTCGPDAIDVHGHQFTFFGQYALQRSGWDGMLHQEVGAVAGAVDPNTCPRSRQCRQGREHHELTNWPIIYPNRKSGPCRLSKVILASDGVRRNVMGVE